MLSDEKYSELYQKAKLWYEQHVSIEEIQKRLNMEGHDEVSTIEIIKQIKMIHYAAKRKRGSMIILTGSILLLVGFVMTVSNFYANQSIHYVMYGFTSAGLLIIFIGLYDIFG